MHDKELKETLLEMESLTLEHQSGVGAELLQNCQPMWIR